MARKGKDEEELLSFSPKNKKADNFDLDFWDDEEEEEEVVEEPVVEEPVVEEPVVEEEAVEEEVEVPEEENETEEEPAVEEEIEEEIVEEAAEEEEAVEEEVEEVTYEEVEEPEEAIEEEVEEVDIEEITPEEEAVEEVDVDDIVIEEEPEEEVVIPVIIPEEEPEEEVVEEDDGYDRTNIFEHATVYYDQNTIILPRNFESRIKMASPEVKKLYSEIKNVLMEYSNVKSRMLKYVEVFRCGGAVAKMRIKGKSLYLYLKLDPASVDQDYLKVVDKSERRGYEETPAEIKVTGKRKCKRSIEMIRLMMDALGVGHRRHPEVVDYAAKYPTPENAVILGKNMVKVSKKADYD